MQLPRSIIAAALVGLVAAGCGASSPTQAPGAATQAPGATQDTGGGGGGGGGGGATDQPQATQGGGGGGGSKPAGWDQFGKVSYQIGAPLNLNDELGFVPAASVFGSDQTTSLSFTVDGTNTVLTVQIVQGKTTVSFGSDTAGTVIGSECTTSNLSLQASSASGSFQCPGATAIMASGAQVTNVTFNGTFNVHG